MAATEGAKEAMHLRGFLKELGQQSEDPTAVAGDNKADLAYNPEHHPRTKHIARRHFFIRELVEAEQIRVPFVSTINNLADFFTKAPPSAPRGSSPCAARL